LRVISKGQFVGIRVDELEKQVEGDLILLGVVRRGQIMSAYPTLELKGNDIIIIEADSGVLEDLTTTHGFKLVTDALLKKEVLGDEEVIMMEAVVTPQSSIVQRRPGKLQMRKRFGVNLLAVARQGRRLKRRLNNIQLSVGDVLLLRGTKPSLQTAVSATGCLPLAERSLRVGQKRRLLAAVSVFVGALATVVSGLFPIQIAFCLAIVIMTIMGLVSLRELYTAIDWPIIVLLGAMIPVGQALETTGAAALIAQQLLVVASIASPSVVLGIILVGTMFLSDLVNNAAAAILMAPIALGVADSLDVSVDPFLMAVAIGASCAFLTPIGHQSSALVMGPGGYHFGDYWKVGLPLEILIAAIGIPALLYFWPL
jgi:di/tricarboxylate transporter